MKRKALILALQFVGIASPLAQAADRLALTFSCVETHRMIAGETQIPSELFSQEGFLISRTLTQASSPKPSTLNGASIVSFNFADREQVYALEMPPHRNPWRDLKFQVRIPTNAGDRDFCVHSRADGVLPDKLERFTRAPVAGCEGPLVKARVVANAEREKKLSQLQSTLANDLWVSAQMAKAWGQNPESQQTREFPILRQIASLSLKPCEDLESSRAQRDERSPEKSKSKFTSALNLMRQLQQQASQQLQTQKKKPDHGQKEQRKPASHQKRAKSPSPLEASQKDETKE